ncbi:MAG TPA: formate/nitrite transporter family protein [Acidimicrobiales bacterium]|jgi:nitrite transporter NirC|nr:formate/nitrite transporter family protein [Acidimicrobiales bacterium]
MPTPVPDALRSQEDLAADKADQLLRSPLRYLASSALAGAFIGVAVILLLMVSAPLINGHSASTKLVQGSVFGVALTLVVFAGAELFTGNNMVMVIGMVAKRIKTAQLVGVWVASLVGNLIGSVAFAALVNGSGILDSGATPGKAGPAHAALASIVAGKDHLTGGQVFLRAVLCNFLVCLAMWMAARATSDAAKLICLWWALLAFIASGFEHSIANMTVLSLAAFSGDGHWHSLWNNLVWSVPGNIVGGGALVGLAYAYIGRSTRAARISPAAAGSRRELDPMDELEGQLERPALVPQGARLSPAPAE